MNSIGSSSSGNKIIDLLQWGKHELAGLGSEEALVSAERLLGYVLEMQRHALYVHAVDDLSQDSIHLYYQLIARRKARYPLAYLIGKCFFWNEELEVSPDCLIPRQETETLIEAFIEKCGFRSDCSFNILDMGAGSGAIGIALLRHFPNAYMSFVDFSEKALALTKRNCHTYALRDRFEIVQSDLFAAFRGKPKKWDAIVCNPPYLSSNDFKDLQPELTHEPQLALDGGKDGYHFYRRLITESQEYLSADAWFLMELGLGQARQVLEWLQQSNAYRTPIIEKDYLNIDRIVMAQKN